MAWTDLKASIAQVIRTNGNQEITGALLQHTLNTIVDQLGADATLKGVATPATTPNPSDGIAFYIASELGTYANFGGLKVNSGEIAFFYSNGTEWTKMSIDLTQTIAESISDSEATLRQEIAESEGRSGTALSTARGAITQEIAESISDSEATLRQEIAESEGRSSTALSTARGAITQEIAESISDSEATLRQEIAAAEGRSGTALSTAIGAIDEVLGVVNTLKQRAYTLDFGTDSELAQDSNLLGSITINQILTQNVSALYLSYGSVVRQSVTTSGTVSLQIPDSTILTWEIVRETENEPACVGVQFEILTEE